MTYIFRQQLLESRIRHWTVSWIQLISDSLCLFVSVLISFVNFVVFNHIRRLEARSHRCDGTELGLYMFRAVKLQLSSVFFAVMGAGL